MRGNAPSDDRPLHPTKIRGDNALQKVAIRCRMRLLRFLKEKLCLMPRQESLSYVERPLPDGRVDDLEK